jgi:predicted alpha-1,2-mannosidase
MKRTHLPGIARWPSAAMVATAALAAALSLSSPAASAATAAPARPGAGDSGAAFSPGSSHGTACGKTATGGLTDCRQPLSKSQLPAGAKNSAIVSQPVSDIASLVDTRTWTSGGGNTFPGADVPFGMVQWSPDTSPDRSDGGGYDYGDTSLIGYSLTHISGPGCGAGGDVPILPMTGALPSGNPNSVLTSFTNTGEVAQAGYYSAQSNMPDTITSEFTATPHTSMGRFTFPPTTQADFLIKLQDSQNGDFGDSAQVVGDNEVTGTDTSGDFCDENNNDGQLQQYTVHFDVTFSQPFTASQVVTESGQTNPAAVFLTFDTTSNPVIDAKVAISYVSTANAQLNLRTENHGWDFNSVKTTAQASWNRLLGRIQVGGGSYAQTQEFYSLLYKDFMQPNISSDVNGQYMGADMQVHTISGRQKNQYGTYSGWDIYHSLSQLQAMLDPSAASDQAQSLVNYYSQDQILQQWGYLNLNNYVMVGDPAQSIISDYYAFGARNFDTSQALADMLKQATTVNDVRPGEALEAKYGYLPADGSYGCCNPHGVVATELEYDTEDLALSQFASALGDSKDAAMLERRANNWESLFDPDNDLLNPRTENGQLVSGITPTFADSSELYYVEGDAYEYLWDTPNDYAALFSLMGGNSKVAPEISQYLSQPNGYGMFAQLSNEFDFGEQYMPDYDGDPAGAQLAVNTMLNTMQAPGPSGLPNNDDLGANSSTTVWEMLGMYPENSGTGTLVFSGPHFPQASIRLRGGKTITINAPAASASNYYVQNLKLNGSPYHKLYVPFSTLSRGATLDWTMGSSPSTWGNAPQDAPPSYKAGLRPVVGFASSPEVTIAPGGTATVQIGAQNATGSRQSVQASVSAPSGITASLAGGTVNIPPDGQGTETLTVHASASANQTFYTVPISLTDGKTTLPTVDVTVHLAGADPQQVTPVITQVSPPAGSLQVVLANNTDTSSTVTAVNWTLGSQSGTQALNTTIAPQSSATVSVDVGSPNFAQIYPFTVTSVLSNGLDSAPLSGHVTFLPVMQKDLGSSWSLSQVQGDPSVDLATTADGTWGAVGSPQAPAGLSGKVWLDWDSSNLYITAEINDDNFSEPAVGVNIWQGDSLQVAATSGVPGSSATVSTASTDGHYEYGAALTSQGAQVYRWIAPAGVATGPVTDAAVNVTRDDATDTTLYELAIPWSDLTSVQPGAGTVFSISLLDNDTDNATREGFLQWGGGIGADKNVSEFNMAQLMPATGA